MTCADAETYVDAETALSTLRREVLALIAENRRMREALEALEERAIHSNLLDLTAVRRLIETALETKK